MNIFSLKSQVNRGNWLPFNGLAKNIYPTNAAEDNVSDTVWA